MEISEILSTIGYICQILTMWILFRILVDTPPEENFDGGIDDEMLDGRIDRILRDYPKGGVD